MSQDNGRDESRQVEAFQAVLTAVREAHAGEVAALREQAKTAEAHCKLETTPPCSHACIVHAESRRAASAMGQYRLDGRLTSGRNPRCR
jgi:hypothetical protein